MLPIGMILTVVAYGATTYGYILVKGYNITVKEWFSPLKPYTGALNANGTVPPGNLWPTNTPKPPNATTDATGQASAAPSGTKQQVAPPQ